MSIREFQNNQNNDYACFIRRRGPQGWTRGRAHHQAALEAFLELPSAQQIGAEPVRISVPHEEGGTFVAWFQKLNPAIYQYRDESNHLVDIMMSSSSYAAFINRMVDHS